MKRALCGGMRPPLMYLCPVHIPLMAEPTELQRRAFGLPEIGPAQDVAMQVTG